MKLALQSDNRPEIGGVMIMGDRGTGKSTIRAIADLLPEVKS
jgi:magnesium chelatase subunit I